MSFGAFVAAKPWVSERSSGEDRELTLAASGDVRAFDDLMLRYDRDLRAFLGRKISGESLEDVLQEVRLAAWSGLKNFDRRSRFKTWLYSVAIHKYKDYCRRSVRLDVEFPLTYLDGGFAAPDAFARSDSAAVVGSMLDSLSEDQREVVELYYCGGLNLSEVARTLGRNVNTVKYQFYRAHAQIADAMTRQSAQEKHKREGDRHASRM